MQTFTLIRMPAGFAVRTPGGTEHFAREAEDAAVVLANLGVALHVYARVPEIARLREGESMSFGGATRPQTDPIPSAEPSAVDELADEQE